MPEESQAESGQEVHPLKGSTIRLDTQLEARAAGNVRKFKGGCSSVRSGKEKAVGPDNTADTWTPQFATENGARGRPFPPSLPPVPSVEAAALSFRVPSEQAEEGWWGGRSACQEVGGIVVEKLAWTPAMRRDRSRWVRREPCGTGGAGAPEPPPGPFCTSTVTPPLLHRFLSPSSEAPGSSEVTESICKTRQL